MNNYTTYSGYEDGQVEGDGYQGVNYTTDNPGQVEAPDDPGYAIGQYNRGASPWTQYGGGPGTNTWPSGAVHYTHPNDSQVARVGSDPDSAGEQPLVNGDKGQKEKKKEKKEKKSGKSGGKKDGNGGSKKHRKDDDGKKHRRDHKGHGHEHGHGNTHASRQAA